MLKAPLQRPRGRNKPVQKTPVRIVSATAATTVLTIVFDQPVILKGIPAYSVDVVGPTRVGAALTSPTTMAITFSATVAAATEISIPFEDPGIRSAVGGFVADSTFPV
jgi:hypothetical protein